MRENGSQIERDPILGLGKIRGRRKVGVRPIERDPAL